MNLVKYIRFILMTQKLRGVF